jgi:hypothetical protein
VQGEGFEFEISFPFSTSFLPRGFLLGVLEEPFLFAKEKGIPSNRLSEQDFFPGVLSLAMFSFLPPF